tara:strand:- start:926 stop:1144 length:219 start_codon:yes stop_codon:yes gene_type:complete
MVRSEALKKAQQVYRQKHRERLNVKVREYKRVYAKNHYDEDEKQKRKQYYLMNRNYINKDFSKDLIEIFKEL